MKPNFARLGAAIAVALAAAVALALQAASTVTERTAPEVAMTLNPLNGQAAEQAAFARFSAASSSTTSPDPAEIAKSAEQIRPLALAAYQSAPLTPKALALVALGTADPERRETILGLANRLNRRDLPLQLAVLENALGNQRAVRAITTLDQLLRVNPEYSEQFFPSLQQALLIPETQSTFAKLLDGSSPWHDAFAMFAVRDPAARLRLARIRSQITISDENFDRQLIAGLAAQGELQLASEAYRAIASSADRVRDGATVLSWRGDYPPFDWQYLDRKEIRAQPSLDGARLEIFIRPGEGGNIAQRIIPLTGAANRQLSFKLDSTRAIAPGRLRMSLYCGTAQQPVTVEDLSTGTNTITFTPEAEACEALRIEIYARAYRGEPVFRARIGQLRLS